MIEDTRKEIRYSNLYRNCIGIINATSVVNNFPGSSFISLLGTLCRPTLVLKFSLTLENPFKT